jgi:hypothetical protein
MTWTAEQVNGLAPDAELNQSRSGSEPSQPMVGHRIQRPCAVGAVSGQRPKTVLHVGRPDRTGVQTPEPDVSVQAHEAGKVHEMRRRAQELVGSGVRVIVALAHSDDGAPYFDQRNAKFFASIGAPAFACRPRLFSDLIPAAIERCDIAMWASDILTIRSEEE